MNTNAMTVVVQRRFRGTSWQRTLTFSFSLIALLSCLSVGGLTYYLPADYLRAEGIREQRFNHLEQVCDDKIRAINSWLGERRNDMRVWSETPIVVAMCAQHQEGTEVNTPENRAYHERLRAACNYDVVFVADPENGRPLVNSDPVPHRMHQLAEPLLRRVMQEQKAIITDVFLDEVDGRPEIAVISPVEVPATGETAGILCFHMDGSSEFYLVF